MTGKLQNPGTTLVDSVHVAIGNKCYGFVKIRKDRVPEDLVRFGIMAPTASEPSSYTLWHNPDGRRTFTTRIVLTILTPNWTA